MAKYLKINGKVCLDTWRSMSRPFFRLFFPVEWLARFLGIGCHDILSAHDVNDGLRVLMFPQLHYVLEVVPGEQFVEQALQGQRDRYIDSIA